MFHGIEVGIPPKFPSKIIFELALFIIIIIIIISLLLELFWEFPVFLTHGEI